MARSEYGETATQTTQKSSEVRLKKMRERITSLAHFLRHFLITAKSLQHQHPVNPALAFDPVRVMRKPRE